MGSPSPARRYQPMGLAQLGGLLVGADESLRWRLIAEFLEEYRWEPVDERLMLLADEPDSTGDQRWDVFLIRATGST